MVLRKPYAFLIKHFRLIHFLLFGLILFITFSTKAIIDSFGFLADQGKLDYYNNVGIFVYLAIFLSIIFGFAMLLLMTRKRKPKRFYLLLMLYYIGFLISLLITNNIFMNLMENKIISIQTARAYYDISRIIYWPQLLFIVFSLVRAVGFDIKRFGFEKDLVDLDLSDQDREEFEVSIKLDYFSILTRFRRYLRELKYYFLENVTIIISLIIILVLGLGITIFINLQVKNKIYSEANAFKADNFQFSINSSYLTNSNQAGEIFKDNLYYLIIDLNIKNIKNKAYKIQLSDFTIQNNNHNFFTVSQDINDFIDLGVAYKNEEIEAGDTINKILIFEINNYNFNDNKFTLKILNYFKINNDAEEPVYTFVNLSPKLIAGLIVHSKKYYGLTTKLNGSILKNSSIKINDYKIRQLFIYDYKKCITKDNCQNLNGVVKAKSNSVLLILDYDLVLDKTSLYQKNTNNILNFFNDYVAVRYTVSNRSIIAKTKLVNPLSYKEKVALQVDASLENAQTIDLLITIRNQRYIISLK